MTNTKGLLIQAGRIIKRTYKNLDKFGKPQIRKEDVDAFYKIPQQIRFEAQRLVLSKKL